MSNKDKDNQGEIELSELVTLEDIYTSKEESHLRSEVLAQENTKRTSSSIHGVHLIIAAGIMATSVIIGAFLIASPAALGFVDFYYLFLFVVVAVFLTYQRY